MAENSTTGKAQGAGPVKIWVVIETMTAFSETQGARVVAAFRDSESAEWCARHYPNTKPGEDERYYYYYYKAEAVYLWDSIPQYFGDDE